MLVNRFHALLALVAIGGVSVQGQGSGFDSCGDTCLTTARTQVCPDPTNTTCGCDAFSTFESAVNSCLGSECSNSTTDQTALANLAQTLCGTQLGNTTTNDTTTGNGTTTDNGTTTGNDTSTDYTVNGTSTPSTSSARTSTTSGTLGTSTPASGASLLVQLPLLSAVVAIAGVAVVGAFA